MKPRIVRALRGAGLLTPEQVRDRLRDSAVPTSTVLKFLEKLANDGRVRRSQSGHWELVGQ